MTVGVAGSREIDFVAERRSGRRYVQVAYLLESPATIERELAAFAAVRDAYPRVLLSLDPHQPADLEGVRHQSLTDFLRGAPLGASTGSGPRPRRPRVSTVGVIAWAAMETFLLTCAAVGSVVAAVGVLVVNSKLDGLTVESTAPLWREPTSR